MKMKRHFRKTKLVLAIVVIFGIGYVVINRSTAAQNFYSKVQNHTVEPNTNSNNTLSTQNNLARQQYTGQQVIDVNNGQPDFSIDDLSITKGAWQKLSLRDWEGRSRVANAMLNQTLMPSATREKLTVNPSGYHVYRDESGNYLYNRSHIIGYQLTGENNNLQNLFTGTVALNALHTTDNQWSMENYEDEVATYLKQDKKHYVRYRVTPIYSGLDLVPRGVQMEGQSVGSDQIRFNVYIFNVQPGWQINYLIGTARKF